MPIFSWHLSHIFFLILIILGWQPEAGDPLTEPPAQRQSPLGTNLSDVTDWSSQWVFTDAFKASRSWIPQCQQGQPADQADCVNSWNTQEYDLIDVDEQGWVRSLPAPEDAPQFWFVGTLMFRSIGGRYPAGEYTVLYDGEGRLEYDFDAQKDETASIPGRDILHVTPSQKGIYLKLTQTDPYGTGNYLRNIRVIMPGFAQTYKTEIFHPEFLKTLQDYSTLRFMVRMKTNNATQQERQEWTNRPKPTDARYSTAAEQKGVPLEVMLALSTRLSANPWFTLPHQATDEYIRQFASVTLDLLDADQQVYVEYSNEVWNGSFSQGAWVEQQGQIA